MKRTAWSLISSALLTTLACASAPTPMDTTPQVALEAPDGPSPTPTLSTPDETTEGFTAREPRFAPGEHPLPNPPMKRVHQGSLEPQVIQRVVRQHMARFRVCYERRLKVDPEMQTKPPKVAFKIASDGSTAEVVVDTGDPELDACLIRQLEAMRFPPPTDGEVRITYPMH